MNTLHTTTQQVVVLAEDEAITRLHLTAVLEDAGYKVLAVADGTEALELFATQPVDCVVTDVNMPKLGGFELCAMLRVMERGERVQILMLTGQNDYDSIKQAYEVGANDFVTKAANPLLMVQRVRFLLRSQQIQDTLRISEQRLSHAQRLAQLGHWERDLDGHTLSASGMLPQLLEMVDASNLSWAYLCRHTHPDDLPSVQRIMQRAIEQRSGFRLEHRFITERDRPVILRHQGELVMDLQGHWFVRSTVQDVTESRAQEERIRFLAFHDPLTTLPNRESARRQLSRAIELSTNTQCIAVFALGLDDFARVGGSLGQQISDSIIKSIGERLRSQIRDSDHLAQDSDGESVQCMVARGEGDKFLCIVNNLQLAQAATGIAKRLQRAVAAPLELGETHLRLTASVGVSLYPQDGRTAEELLDSAAAALTYAKGKKGACQFFAHEISVRARERLTLESELRQALEAQHFELFYQPRIGVLDQRVHSAEALVRWRHPTRGLILPGEFIPLLEEMGLIADLGKQVLTMVAQQSALWRNKLGRHLRLSFNLSPLQLINPDLAQQIESTISNANAHFDNLEVEITESAVLSQPELAIHTLKLLRSYGMLIALDDFGTGYSSLGQLRQLPLDVLKIDRSFVADIGMSPGGSAMIQAILFMANALGLKSVAEGVERETQLHFLAANNCHEAQGFLLAKPMSVTDFERWWQHWQLAHSEQKFA